MKPKKQTPEKLADIKDLMPTAERLTGALKKKSNANGFNEAATFSEAMDYLAAKDGLRIVHPDTFDRLEKMFGKIK
jgi:hypothetical protein